MKKLLEYSIKHNLRHIPSALSQYTYLKILLPLIKDWNICIGKPFGSQAYYCIWEEMGILPDKELSYGVKNKELDFVNYSEETLGNALGVAGGIAIGSNNSKRTYVNISDGALQMGPTLEAIQFIGKMKPKLLCSIDFNSMQLTGSTVDILNINIDQQISFFKSFNWDVYVFDKDSIQDFKSNVDLIININKPTVIFFKTIKGQGVIEMENDPVLWHYKQLKDIYEVSFIKND